MPRKYPKKINGKTVQQWADELGLAYDCLRHRLKKLPPEQALKPGLQVVGPKPLWIMGKTIQEWAKELGRSETSVRHRLARYPAKLALVPKKPKKVKQPPGKRGRPLGSTKDDVFVKKGRNVEMYRKRLAGATYPELGQEYGITHQGAKAVCDKMRRLLG